MLRRRRANGAWIPREKAAKSRAIRSPEAIAPTARRRAPRRTRRPVGRATPARPHENDGRLAGDDGAGLVAAGAPPASAGRSR
jgi:hypothetical protein